MVVPSLQALADTPGPFAAGQYVQAQDDGHGGVQFAGASVDLSGLMPKAGGIFTGAVAFGAQVSITGLSGVLKATAGVVFGSATTTDLPEGSNQYFTTGRAQSAVAGIYLPLAGGTLSGPVVGSGAPALGNSTTGRFGDVFSATLDLNGATESPLQITGGNLAVSQWQFGVGRGGNHNDGYLTLYRSNVNTGRIFDVQPTTHLITIYPSMRGSGNPALGDSSTGRFGSLFAGAGDFSAGITAASGSTNGLTIGNSGIYQLVAGSMNSFGHLKPYTNLAYDLGDSTTPLRWRSFIGAKLDLADSTATLRFDSANGFRLNTATSSGWLNLGVLTAGDVHAYLYDSAGATRTKLHPDVADGNSAAIAYLFDTRVALTTNGILHTKWATGGTLLAALDRSGNLGIGSVPNLGGWTAGTDTVLTVKGVSRTGALELASGFGDTTGLIGVIDFVNASNTGGKEMAQIQGQAVGTTAGNRGSQLNFYTKPDGGTITLRAVIDSIGRVLLGSTGVGIFNPDVADGASAIAWLFDTKNSLVTAGAKLLSVRNATVEKLYVAYDGSAVLAKGLGMFATAPPSAQPAGGAQTAGAAYGATEQDMLQKAYNACRSFGLLA